MKTDPTGYAEWRHSRNCKYNYTGIADGIESEEAKCVFDWSITQHNLRQVEFLGVEIYADLEIKTFVLAFRNMLAHDCVI